MDNKARLQPQTVGLFNNTVLLMNQPLAAPVPAPMDQFVDVTSLGLKKARCANSGDQDGIWGKVKTPVQQAA
jgi:hypothetical protein